MELLMLLQAKQSNLKIFSGSWVRTLIIFFFSSENQSISPKK